MLLERAATVAERISEYQKLHSMADEGEKFHTRAKQLGDISEKLSKAREVLAKLASAGIKINFMPSEGANYAEKARVLRTAVRDDPAVMSNPPFDLKNEFTDRLAGVANAADKATAEAWRSHIEEHSDLGSDDVLTALAAVPQFRQHVLRIRECRAEIDRLANGIPIDPKAALKRLTEVIALRDAAWAGLSAEDIPVAVIEFIRASAGDGASLTAYSDDVRAWLMSRNLVGAFRIKIR